MMKRTLLLLHIFLATTFLFAQSAEFNWAISCGNPPNTTDTKTVLAHGNDGYFYLAGEFIDTANYGDHSMISAGGTDIGLVRYDSQGTVDWAIQIGSVDYDFVQRIGVMSDGNIVLAGYFYGSTMIGSDSYTSYGSQDIFLALFDPEGNFLWSERFGGLMADYVSSAETDEEDNIVIAGYFYGDLAIGDTVLKASASSDIFLAKFSSSGELAWVMAAGGSSSDQVRTVSCDPNGNIFFTGSFYYDFTIADTTLSTADPVGAVVAEIAPDGDLLRIFQLQGTYLTPDIFVKADQTGNFYLAGNFSEQIFFGDTVFTAGPFNQDVFAARYSSSGDLIWARHGTSPSSDQIIGIDVDPFNNLYVTGHYLDTISFGQLILPYKLCCGSREIFIVNYSNDGKELWGRQITGPRASVQSLSMNEDGALLLSGMFADTLAFDELDLSNFNGYRTYITCLSTDMYTAIPGMQSEVRQLIIFPNPSREFISIAMPEGGKPFYLMIFTVTGELVIKGHLKSESGIDISALKPGVYFIRVEDDSGKYIASGKFVRQ